MASLMMQQCTVYLLRYETAGVCFANLVLMCFILLPYMVILIPFLFQVNSDFFQHYTLLHRHILMT